LDIAQFNIRPVALHLSNLGLELTGVAMAFCSETQTGNR
jgi:hypothetical protein